MGLNEIIHGTNVAKYAIEPNDTVLFTFTDMEEKIMSRQLRPETNVFCTEDTSALPGGRQKTWKPAKQYYELRKVFEKLPPPCPSNGEDA